jgi:hypothetical protein
MGLAAAPATKQESGSGFRPAGRRAAHDGADAARTRQRGRTTKRLIAQFERLGHSVTLQTSTAEAAAMA